jgi:sugar phosphate isomerase/epimerase
MPPKLAAFPKCFMDALCVQRTMSVFEWIDLAATLGVDGLEFYSGFVEDDPIFVRQVRRRLEADGLAMPMMCCSPDFTQSDPDLWQQEIEQEIRMVELTAELGGKYCRVLSGQRRPGLARQAGIDRVVAAIEAVLPTAERNGVTLVMENHYKDNYWTYPEFAQHADLFVEIVDRVDSPWFGVNFDPSNAILAGEDPIKLLERVKHRVKTMHASDRYLTSGTLDDLRREENSEGYAARLAHGTIGQGLNDYDRIFGILASAGFDSWVSIEDGLDGMDGLRESVHFLREKIARHFLT